MTDTLTPDSLRLGSLVGPWRVEGYAGCGTYGAVYQARCAGHPGSLPVALKLALFAHDPRFEREVGMLSRLEHPAIPRLVDRGWWHSGAEGVHPYLVMEWIRGQTLYEWARVHQPTSRQVLRVLSQVLWGLQVVHRAGGLHRDVKGDNLLVEPEGRALLTDFGSSTWEGAAPITERMMAPGTHEYRSPEALRFQWKHWREKEARYEARPADDVYALGVSMYRLVTGRYPPPGTDPGSREDCQLAPIPQRLLPQEFNRRVVPEMAVLIERMMASEPEARGGACEVAEAVESAAEHVGEEADVPLWGPERSVAAGVIVPVRRRRMPGSEGAVSRAVVVPTREALLSGADEPWVEAVAVPVPARAASRRYSRVLRPGLVAAATILVGVGIGWMSHWPRKQAIATTWAGGPDSGTAPDAGTRGLGDSTPTTRVASQRAPVALDARVIGDDVPEQPLPGQRRAPCRGAGQVEINGGCWRRLSDAPPSCGEDAYEWKRACYYPVQERAQPRTSKKAR
jgi:eukaryotic-like serine/threonine-protein kinase